MATLEQKARQLATSRNLADLESLLTSALPARRMRIVAAAARAFLDQRDYDQAVAWMQRALDEPQARPIELLELGRYAGERHTEPRVLALSVRLLERALAERDPSDPSLLDVEMYDHASRGFWELRVLPEPGHGTTLLETRPGLWAELRSWLEHRLTSAC